MVNTRYHSHPVASSKCKKKATSTGAHHSDAILLNCSSVSRKQMAQNDLNTASHHRNNPQSSEYLVQESSIVTSSSSTQPPPSIPPYLTTVRIQISAGTVALLLLFISATFHSLAKYFYSYYKLIFGTLYPAYASYKAIKNKNIREYARWMMFWVSFGIFSFVEVFTDLLLAFWLPFYHEIKILFILWLMSPYGNGARVMYKNIIHPELRRREEVIDSYIERAKEIGIVSLFSLWSKASDCVNVLAIRMIHMTQAVVVSHMERIVNSQIEGANSSPLFLPLPSVPASTASSRMSDAAKSSRHANLKSQVASPTGDIKDSLQLLDDTLNLYEDSSPVSEALINRHFEDFSSSQGDASTEEDEPRKLTNNESTYSTTGFPSAMPRTHRNTVASSFTYSDSSYSNRSIPSVEVSRSRLEERIEARIRRNRVRPPLRASIFLDTSHPDSSVFTRR